MPTLKLPRLSKADQVLLAVDKITEPLTNKSVSVEFIVVQAWVSYPESFGLRYYATTHPDSNRVIICLAGKRGLVGRGLLTRTAPDTYALTAAGRRRVAELLGQPVLKAAGVELAEADAEFMRRLLDSGAKWHFDEGMRERVRITFRQACAFWNEEGQSDHADSRIRITNLALDRICDLIGDQTADLGDGRSVSAGDVRALARLSEWLEERFKTHLKLLRQRQDSSQEKARA